MTMYLFLGLDVFAVDSMSVTAQKIFEVMDSGSDKILYLIGKNTIYLGYSAILVLFALMFFKVVCQNIFYEPDNSPAVPREMDEQRHEQQPQESTTTTIATTTATTIATTIATTTANTSTTTATTSTTTATTATTTATKRECF